MIRPTVGHGFHRLDVKRAGAINVVGREQVHVRHVIKRAFDRMRFSHVVVHACSHDILGLDDDAEHGRARVRVVEEVVRLFRDGVLHVHLVAADVPVLLRDGVLEVDVVVGRVQGRVDARRDLRVTMSSHRADTVDSGGDHRQALRVAGI